MLAGAGQLVHQKDAAHVFEAPLILAEAGGEDASALAARPHAPPVLLCGTGDDFTLMSRAVANGVYDYVPLPVDPTDMGRKVARALRSRR